MPTVLLTKLQTKYGLQDLAPLWQEAVALSKEKYGDQYWHYLLDVFKAKVSVTYQVVLL